MTRPRKPGFIVPNKGGSYALHYHAEQAPNPLSRITLTTEKDAFGMPRASIDMRYSDQDVDSVLDRIACSTRLSAQNRTRPTRILEIS